MMIEGTSEDDLAAELGCPLITLRWLFLCRLPSPARFSSDLQRIADRFDVKVDRLASLIRRAGALQVLGRGQGDDSRLLLAARDRDQGEGSE